MGWKFSGLQCDDGSRVSAVGAIHARLSFMPGL